MTRRFDYLRRSSRVDLRAADVSAALIVLRTVAGQDADFARKQNGVGFSKADSRKGHALSSASLTAVMSDELTISEVLRMGKRYSRQAGRILQGDFFRVVRNSSQIA